MKTIVMVIVLFSVLHLLPGTHNKEDLRKNKYEKLKTILNGKRKLVDSGLENWCSGISNKFSDAVTAFEECNNNIEDSLTNCQIVQSFAINCTAPLAKVFADCLPNKAKQLPELAIRSFVSGVGYLCQLKGASIFELANSCVWNSLENPTEELKMCQKNILMFVSKQENSIPSPEDLCNFSMTTRSCMQNLTAFCKNLQTKVVFLEFYDAITAPCYNLKIV